MTELEVIRPAKTGRSHSAVWQGRTVHLLRWCLFLAILMLIRDVSHDIEFVDSNLERDPETTQWIQSVLSSEVSIDTFDSASGRNVVRDSDDEFVGYLLQTSPAADDIVGYSGPTNCLILLDENHRIMAVAIRESGDTVDHVDQVKQAPDFLAQFKGLGFEEPPETWQQIDGVTGATLTSYAAIASIAKRLNGETLSLKFEPQPRLENVKTLLPEATSLSPSDRKSVWLVHDVEEQEIGLVLTTTPSADHLSGYQGPTATLAIFDSTGKCIGLQVDQSYENEPYASYLNDDYSFLAFYSGKTIEEIAKIKPEVLGIEGVSGATMTSMSVAEALPLAARRALEPAIAPTTITTRKLSSYWPDLLTVLLTLIGMSFSFGQLSRRKNLRITYQLAVIILLGFVCGQMVSQSLMVGWSSHSIPWSVVPGLVFLTAAALIVPGLSRHQPYCQHICPFGAIQQLTRNRLPWRLKIAKTVSRGLELIPFLLLMVVVYVAFRKNLNLASLEPFDAFSISVAGWATIGVFVAGVVFSLVSPMGYCRFGCPTGAMLNFLKFRGDSHRLGRRDCAAILLAVLAVSLHQGWI